MVKFEFETALNQLEVIREPKNTIKQTKIPAWVIGGAFRNVFLPHLTIIGDSREQDKWIEKACEFYGIGFGWATKTKTTENLKEGDYTFKVTYKNRTDDFIGRVAYERKGSLSELYNNCTGYNPDTGLTDRYRFEREMERFGVKRYLKTVLMIEYGESLLDLIGADFEYRGRDGNLVTKDVKWTIFSTLASWKQPNNKNFEIIQSASHNKLFWLMLMDMYYFYRNEIKNECEEKGLLKENQYA